MTACLSRRLEPWTEARQLEKLLTICLPLLAPPLSGSTVDPFATSVTLGRRLQGDNVQMTTDQYNTTGAPAAV